MTFLQSDPLLALDAVLIVGLVVVGTAAAIAVRRMWPELSRREEDQQ